MRAAWPISVPSRPRWRRTLATSCLSLTTTTTTTTTTRSTHPFFLPPPSPPPPPPKTFAPSPARPRRRQRQRQRLYHAATAATAVPAAELQFGQPLHETHPHILKAGELTPGISALEYHERRSALAAKLPTNSIAVLAAADVKYRSGAVFYDFHQDSNFFYLTGFNEPEALAVIGKTKDGADPVFHLFVRPKDPKAEMWEGPRSGLDAATDVFNADETGDINQLHKFLKPLLSSASGIYTDLAFKATPVPSVFSRLFSKSTSDQDSIAGLIGARNVKPLKPLLHELRAFKSDAEIANLRKAGQASGRAISQAMRRKWHYEKDLANFIEHRFKRLGCDASAYIPVIAGGRNALTIHYTSNDGRLRDGDLALVDAGGEYGHYASDITRTFPLAAAFTPAQRDLYCAVLDVQRSCVSLCRADAHVSLDKLHEIAERGLRDSLSALGFDFGGGGGGGGGGLELLFPHHVGHYIGLDLHDVPGYSRRETLRAGQCVTVEPGVYVPDDERWPVHFRGLGVRIEDSVAVQAEHPLLLTVEAAKEVDDVEALRREAVEVRGAEGLR